MSNRLVVTDPATRLLDVATTPERTLTVSYSGPNTLTVSEGFLEAASRVFGSAAITLPAVTVQFGVQGTAAATIPAVTVSGTGARVVAGTSAVSTPAVTATAIGSLNNIVTGTGSVSIPSVTASLSGGGAPVLSSVTYTDNNDGTPADLAVVYTGDVTGYRLYLATGTNSLSVSAADLYAGTGGTAVLEFADIALGTNVDVTGLTSTSNTATKIAAALIKSADGSGASNVVIENVTGLDFTDPTFSSAETTSTTTIDITASETLFGSPDPSDFTLTGNTVSAATISGGKVQLTVGTAITPSDDYTGDLSYTQSAGSITDADGNELANFASQDVTNNVTGAASAFEIVGITAFDSNFTSGTFSGVSIGTADASREVICIPICYDAGGETITAIKETDAAGSDFTALTDGTTTATYSSTGSGRCAFGAYSLGVASGTTMDIYLSFSGNISRVALLILRKVGGSIQNISIDAQDVSTTGVSVSPTVAVSDILFALTLMRTGGTPALTGMDGTPTDYAADIAIEGQYVLDTVGTAETRTVSDATANDARLMTINVR